jgi:pimeloyl-ACP methyl ester carboxylesterase
MRSLRRDGVALFYEEAQGDKPPTLLVHGWCGDHTHFAPQFEHFARRGHRVVAVDLRGHGESDKPHQSYTVQLFADDLAWMCAQLGLEKPVVIGHSMGGVVTLALALSYPDLPSAIVMLDAPVVRPADARAALPRFLEQLRGADYREAIRAYVSNVLVHPHRRPGAQGAHRATDVLRPQHVVVSAFEGVRDYDPIEAGGGLAVPGLYVAANEPQPRSDMSRFHEMFPQVLDGKIVGSGHFCQLEVPEQVNAMIDRFLAITFPA